MTASFLTSTAGQGRYRWTLIAFAFAGLLISGLVVWQLYEMTPARWCVLAKQGSPELATGCFNVLLKLLDIKDHALMMLIGVLALTIIAVVAVALGVRISGAAPGGFSVDVGAEKTTVASEGGTATIDTPPAAREADR